MNTDTDGRPIIGPDTPPPLVRPGTGPVIRRAAPDEAGTVAALIASRFKDLRPAAWLVPSNHSRESVLARNFAIWTEHATTGANGHIDVIDDATGIAAALVWFYTPLSLPVDYHRRLTGAVGPNLPRFQTLDALFDVYHPPATLRHDYAAFLAVRADRQRQRLGSALLNQHHAELDAEGIPSYLEAASPEARNLCHRLGYTLYTGGTITLGDGSPFWPMMRQPIRPSGPPRLTVVENGDQAAT